ncbi:hypothetical protein DMN91_001287 [Ooceraea biroi]|uniref:Serum response factor-binding protein n=1 Tax=Ooceraea biroi TaxID=2015173 RepID=A0A026WGL4_OOCBI|nr:serum response factor-binding protein 1 [Ooceraea biroi]EZA54214.1 Serum response factor-binding protein [Ooceraea biroi]RLU27483.1 hypothetical protein DMN91_001287 [Ooceraea biroi]
MTNIEMNNEIVLLRHTVRQARVCVVNKLTKELKLLQNKHGNETQQERYKRKANKLISEIHALKTIKEDNISKYGIMDERSLTETLQDQSLSDGDRVMARIVHYKTLYKKITQFKEKFPNCKQYLTEQRKRPGKLKSKTKNVSKKNNLHKQDKNIKKRKVPLGENLPHSFEDDERNSELPEVKNVSRKRKKLSDTVVESKKLRETEESDTSADEGMDEQPNMTKLCNVTKEATIKRFTEFLGEQESNDDVQTSVEDRNPTGTTVTQENAVDDFFITENNQDYRSNQINAVTLNTNSRQPNAQTRAFPSNNRFTEQNAKYRNDTRLNKSQRYNELKCKPNLESRNKKTFMRTEKRETNKINKDVSKNNLHDIKNTEENVNLHPSWLAKKKQQEIMSQGFQGKKIVFSDY